MIKGKAHVYGDNINTDLIIAGKYTKSLNFQDFADHCLEDLDPDFIKKVEKGDILVAGDNFGCGSSREQAPIALQAAGIVAVIAKSFARIFYRNAINVGLPLISIDTSCFRTGDIVEVDLTHGMVTIHNSRRFSFEQPSTVMQNILKSGGLIPYLRSSHGLQSIDEEPGRI